MKSTFIRFQQVIWSCHTYVQQSFESTFPLILFCQFNYYQERKQLPLLFRESQLSQILYKRKQINRDNISFSVLPPMQYLIHYLYTKYISSTDPNINKICKLEPIDVRNISQQQLQLYFPSVAKNILIYSAANMTLTLSLPHLLVFQRLDTIAKILSTQNIGHNTKDRDAVMYYFREWINNQFLPVSYNSKKKLPDSKYIYIDHAMQEQMPQNKEQKDMKPIHKKSSQPNSHQLVMINIIEITKHMLHLRMSTILNMQVNALEKIAQNSSKVQDFELLKQKCQWVAIQQYISQHYQGNQDTLMVFNFIHKYPFIDEKELLQRTMLSVIQLRKSVDALIADGFINFYPQNTRTMLFRTIKRQRLNQLVRNHLAHSLMNLYIALDKEKKKAKQNTSKQVNQRNQQKQLQYLAFITKIDDSLILFC